MKCSDVFKKIDEMNDAYLDVWEEVCNIESPTYDKEGVDAVGKYFIRKAGERGWKIDICRQPVSGDVVCITMNPETDACPVSLSGHMDTVHPVGIFGTPAVRRDDKRIYGPGVKDCKGGIVAAFLAMDALWECGFRSRPVQLLLQSDEENSSMTSNKATIQYICKQAEHAVAFLNLEGYTHGKTTLKRKGIASYRFEVTGKESHASRCATEGANAIAEAAHKIIALERLKDDTGITCSCGIIQGGAAVNTIAGKCSFSVNFRFADQKQLSWIREYVEEIAAETHVPGCTCKVEQISLRVAMEVTEKNKKLLERVNYIFAENGLPTLEGRTVRGGSDGADVTAYGIPCLDSLGVIGSGTHSIDEYAELDSLAASAKRLAAIIYCI